MNVLLWIVFGGLVGWLASVIMGTDQSVVWDIVIGILGALLGGWIGDRITGKRDSAQADRPTSIGNFLWALLGAIILILILRLVM